jgi:class 3 adenylate cyclase
VKEKNGFKTSTVFIRVCKAVILLLTVPLFVLFIYWVYCTTYSWELDSLSFRQKLFASQLQDRSKHTPLELILIDRHTMASEPYRKHFQEAVFSRAAAAYAVRFFKRTEVEHVVFDISFNGGIHYNNLAEDEALAESVKGTHNFASLLDFSEKYDPKLSFNGQSLLTRQTLFQNALQVDGLEHFPVHKKDFRFASLLAPYPLLLKSPMRFYSANTFCPNKSNLLFSTEEDSRSEARRWVPFSIYGGYVFPTTPLAVQLGDTRKVTLSANGRLSWDDKYIDLGPDSLPLIKWYGHGVSKNRPVYPETTFSDIVLSEMVLECQEQGQDCKKMGLPARPIIQPDRFKHKYVLIGFNLPNKIDKHNTIFEHNYSGIFILANIMDNALHNEFVLPAPLWLNGLFLVLLPLIQFLVVRRYKSAMTGLLMAMVLASGQLLLAIVAYNDYNRWIWVVYPSVLALLCFGATYAYQYAVEYKKRIQLRYAFGKYVSPAVLQIIEQHPEKVTLGGERREMTFLFCDIRGFTSFSDQNEPEVVQAFLTQYFSTMNKIILHDYHGSINKLIGDAIMAYWGFPLQNEDHAFLAVSAAIAMRDAMRQWQNDADKIPITIGIGINTGEAMIGNIGSEDFMDFTVIGDAVNVASRLESTNKEYGTNIIISSFTYEKVKDRIHARRLGWAELKGKEAKVEIYEPLSLK